jgi:NAD(P)-dependent dehydrogenase (short-subunit alcohol dehydrogenase family)
MDRRSDSGGGGGLLLAAAGVGVFLAARSLVRRSRWMELRGKSVLVTGGSRGLGLLLAREFVQAGARVAICARDQDELDRATTDLTRRGGDVAAIACDVTDREQVEQTLRDVEAHFGGIDVLVNNAGTISVGPMEVMNLGDYEEAMKTHFWGPLHTTLAAFPGMKRRGGGRVVNISSIGGKVAVPHLLPYCASKFALTGLSEGLRAELKKDNIYVTTVCPGLMRTGSPRNAYFKGQHKAEYALFKLTDSTPLTAMDAGRAARRIVLACQRGESEVILGIQAKIAAKFHGVFPGVSSELYGLINHALSGPGDSGEQRVQGKDSESAVSRSFLTALTDRAAARNNEVRATL